MTHADMQTSANLGATGRFATLRELFALREFGRGYLRASPVLVIATLIARGAEGISVGLIVLFLEQTLGDLYAFGGPVLNVSAVPVGLTTFSKHHLVREPTRDECRAAIGTLERWARRARLERGVTWAFAADEMYLRADLPLPDAAHYDGFQQVENGIGAVRWLQQRIQDDREALVDWRGRRIAVLTGSSMAGLMPQVLAPLTEATGATFELIALGNPLFGDSVSCAGLLPGAAFRLALAGRADLDLALIPGESLNENQLFMDDLTLQDVQALAPVEIRPSYHFTDALDTPLAP